MEAGNFRSMLPAATRNSSARGSRGQQRTLHAQQLPHARCKRAVCAVAGSCSTRPAVAACAAAACAPASSAHRVWSASGDSAMVAKRRRCVVDRLASLNSGGRPGTAAGPLWRWRLEKEKCDFRVPWFLSWRSL